MREITYIEIRKWRENIIQEGVTPDILIICTKAKKITLAGKEYDLTNYNEMSPLIKIAGLHVWVDKQEQERAHIVDSRQMVYNE